MKLWLLKRIGGPDFDEYFGFVVRAADEAEARCEALLAAGVHAEEWLEPDRIHCREPWWGDPDLTMCVEVPQDGPIGVVLESYKYS